MTSAVSMPAGHAIVAEDLDAYENATAAWVTWLPTLSNITQGNGTVTATYRQVGKTVDYRFRFIMGTTSAVGTNPGFTLPVAPHSTYLAFRAIMSNAVALVDVGTTTYPGALLITAGSAVYFNHLAPALTAVTATVPFTWTAANFDELIASGTYEAA